MQQENRVSKDEVWSIINLICYRHAKSSLQDFNMKTKISKKAFDSGNNLPSSWRRKKKNHGDMVQFGIIPQRFKQEVGRGQGRAAGHGKQEASRNAG